MAKQNDGRVFDPERCTLPFVSPIPAIPDIEDCSVPDIPAPIFEGPDLPSPIPGPPGIDGAIGATGATGATGAPGAAGPCPQITATVTADCGGEAVAASVDVVSIDPCAYQFNFAIQACQGPQGPCPQGYWVTVLTDFRVSGTELQVKNRRVRVLDREDESDWITVHTGTSCQTPQA